jgi:hypothetical protein
MQNTAKPARLNKWLASASLIAALLLKEKQQNNTVQQKCHETLK